MATVLAGNDVIVGSSGDDTLLGFAGNDTLRGGGGANLYEGGQVLIGSSAGRELIRHNTPSLPPAS